MLRYPARTTFLSADARPGLPADPEPSPAQRPGRKNLSVHDIGCYRQQSEALRKEGRRGVGRTNRLSSSETDSPDDKNRRWERFDAVVACLTRQVVAFRKREGAPCSSRSSKWKFWPGFSPLHLMRLHLMGSAICEKTPMDWGQNTGYAADSTSTTTAG